MPSWYPKIKRGATFRVPITITDTSGVPIPILQTQFRITPEDGSPPFSLTPQNGKLLLNTFLWKGSWDIDTNYSIDDVVRYAGGKNNLWIATQNNIAQNPLDNVQTDWKLFSQFVFLLSAEETASYTWSRGKYKWHRVYGNGDVKIREGLIGVS